MHTVQIFGVRRRIDNRCLTIILTISCVVTLILGILIGRFVTCVGDSPPGPPPGKLNPEVKRVCLDGVSPMLMKEAVPELGQEILSNIRVDKIVDQQWKLMNMTNDQIIQELKTQWKTVHLSGLSLRTNINSLNCFTGQLDILDSWNKTVRHFSLRGFCIDDMVSSSLSGLQIEGDIVYVNFGTPEDYTVLETRASINVSGKILLARDGEISSQQKATDMACSCLPVNTELHEAATRGAAGLVVFDEEDKIWNEDMSSYGGRLLQRCVQIPLFSIERQDVEQLFRDLDSDEVPEEWNSFLNASIKFGRDNQLEWKSRLTVKKSNKDTVSNIIGVLTGNIEGDRYVMVGTHRERGRSDGTTIVVELFRALIEMVKSGRWRPRRSVVFCIWDDTVGSEEWIKQYNKVVEGRIIGYVHVGFVKNDTHQVDVQGTPLSYKLVFKAAKKVLVTYSDQSVKSLYDTWIKKFPDLRLPLPTSRYVSPFVCNLGVPVVDARSGLDSGPTLAQFVAGLTADLADSLILPYNVTDYATFVENFSNRFVAKYQQKVPDQLMTAELLQSAVANFTTEAKLFNRRLTKVNGKDPFVVRSVNDQLLQLNTAFLISRFLCCGITRTMTSCRHALFSNTQLGDCEALGDTESEESLYEASLSVANVKTFIKSVQTAAAILKETPNFVL